MATTFTATWTPGASIDSQTVKYRERGASSWVTNFNIDPINPQTDIAVTNDIGPLNDNTVYQFQIESNLAGEIPAPSSIYEDIGFANPGNTHSTGVGTINIALDGIFPTIDTVTFTVVGISGDPTITTGLAPYAVFTGLPADTYTVEYFFTTIVNGVNVSSTTYSQGSLVVT